MNLHELLDVTPSPFRDVDVWPWMDGMGLRLGVGFDTLKVEPCASAAEESGKSGTEEEQGQKVSYSVVLIEDEREFRQSLSINASASFKNVSGGGSARLSLHKSVKLNSKNVYLMTWVSVVNATTFMDSPRLKTSARELWNNEQEARKKSSFVRVYGDTFVSAVTMGGELIAVFEFSANSAEERERIKVELSGSVGNFSASASYEKAVEAISRFKQTKLTVFRDGSLEPLPELSVDAVLKASRAFPLKVKENPVPISFQTQRYSRIEDPAHIDVESVEAERRIEDLASENDEVQARIETMKAVAREIEQYDEIDAEEVQLQIEQLEDMEIKLRRLAEDAARDRYQKFPTNDYPTVRSLPPAPKPTPGKIIPITVKVMGIKNRDAVDLEGGSDEWVGKGFPTGSFVILCPSLSGDTRLSYMAYMNHRDSAWVEQGTQTPVNLHEGIAIKLIGPDADRYVVSYQVAIFRTDSTLYGQNGSYAGLRDRKYYVGGIRVVLRVRS